MSTPQIALPGLEIDPGNGPILGNFGQGAMEIAIREAIAEIEADTPLIGVQRARKQQAISLAISIDRGNTKGRSIASDSERLDAVTLHTAEPSQRRRMPVDHRDQPAIARQRRKKALDGAQFARSTCAALLA